MSVEHFRKKRDIKTIEAMIRIYCNGQHGTGVKPCPECEGLLRYAIKRINQCPLKDLKTTCAKCSVHCYVPAMREKIKDVMRYSGPHMVYRHPILSLLHLFDGLRPRLKGARSTKH